MTGPKYLLFFGLIILLVTCAGWAAAQTCPSGYSTLQRLQFNAAQKANYQYTAGVTHLTDGFRFNAPASSSAAIAFNNRIHVKSGLEVSFRYQLASPTTTTGFAFVVQNDRADQREGSNQQLGYGFEKGLAVEFDFFQNNSVGGATDCATIPHAQISASQGSTRVPWGCTSTNVAITAPAANTNVDVKIVFTPTATPGTYQVALTHGSTSTTWASVALNQAFDVSNVDIGSGAAWVGFTTASNDNVAAGGITITNVVVKTAPVQSLQFESPPALSNTVSNSFTSTTAFNGNVSLRDYCGNFIRVETEETLTATAVGFDASAVSTFGCSQGPTTRSILNSGQSNQRLLISARLGCTIATTGSGISWGMTLSTTTVVAPVTQVVTFAANVRFTPGAAVAQRSSITSVSIVGKSPALCSSKATCDTGFNTPEKITAGETLRVVFDLADSYGNKITAGTATSITLALNPTPAESPPATTAQAPTLDLVPTLVTSSSTLAVTINSQSLTNNLKFEVLAANPAGPQSVVTEGTGLAQFVAGEVATFVLNLKDRYSNQISADWSASQPQGVVFTLRPAGSGSDCTTTNTVGFAEGCPTALVQVAGAPGFISFTARPTTAQIYNLVCRIGTEPCFSFSSTGYEITVVAAAEDPTKTTIVGDTAKGPWDYSGLLTSAIPSTITANNYYTVNSRTSFNIRAFDQYGNSRAQAANSGVPFTIQVDYRYTDPCTGSAADLQDRILCSAGAIGGSAATVTGATECVYSSSSGYTVNFSPKKTTYRSFLQGVSANGLADIKPNIMVITPFQGTTAAVKSYFILSAAASPSTTATCTQYTVGLTGSGITDASRGTRIVTDSIYTYKLSPIDDFGNFIQPLTTFGVTAGTGTTTYAGPLDDLQESFQLTHSLTTTDSTKYPQTNTGVTSSGRPLFRWVTEPANPQAGSWVTTYLLRGAFSHTPTAFFKQASWGLKPSTSYQVVAGTPTKVGNAGVFTTYPTTTNANAKYTIFYTPLDKYDNPTWFIAATGSAAVTGSCAGEITKSSTSICPIASDPQVCTGAFDRATAATSCQVDITSTFGSITAAPVISVTFPKVITVSFIPTWAKTTTAPNPTSTTAPTGLTWATGALSLVAGEYLWMRFVPSVTEDVSAANFGIEWKQGSTTVVPFTTARAITTFGSDTTFYVAFQGTLVGSTYLPTVSYLGTPITLTSGASALTNTSITVGKFSLEHSIVDAKPNGYIACSSLASSTNDVTITAVDAFNNPITNAASVVTTWTSVSTTFSANTAPTGSASGPSNNIFTYKICDTTANYLQFSIATTTPTSYAAVTKTQIVVIAPGAPVTFQRAAGATAVDCTVGETCTFRLDLVDTWGNVLTAATRADTVRFPTPTFAFSTDAAATAPTANTDLGSSAKFNLETRIVAETKTVGVADFDTSGDSIVVSLGSDYLKYSRDSRTLTAQFSTLVTTPITFNLKVASFASFWAGGRTSLPVVYSNTAATPINFSTSQASSVGVAMRFSFYDFYLNPWIPASRTDLTGNLQSTNAPSPLFVALSNNPDLLTNTITTSPIFQSAFEFTLSRIIIGGTSLPGFNISITAGPISRWDFVYPSYGGIRIAGTAPASLPPAASDNVAWRVNATPYDEFSNIVVDDTVVTAAVNNLRLRVFEGTTSCSSGNPTVASTLSRELTDTSVFTIQKDQVQADKSFPLYISTTLANTLTVAGSRLTYTYYFKLNPTATTVLSCSGATINVKPAAIDRAKTTATIKGLENAAVRAGTKITLTVTPLDTFSNFVGYTGDAGVDGYAPKVYSGACPSPSVEESAADTVEFATVASQQDISITLSSDITTFAVGSSSAALFTDCQTVRVYPSFPSTIAVKDSADPTDSTYTNNFNLRMTAGVPHTFEISSQDCHGTDLNYNHAAVVAPRTYRDFDSFQYVYQVTATFRDPIVQGPSGSSDLEYTIIQYSEVPPFTPGSGGAVIFQTVTLTPAWPGFYSFAVQVVHRTTLQPLSLTDCSIVQQLITLNPQLRLKASNPICSTDEVYKPVVGTPYGTCEPIASASLSFTCESGITVGIDDYSTAGSCACGGGFQKCGSRCINGSTCPVEIPASEPVRVCPPYYHLCGDLFTCALTAAECPAVDDCPTASPHRCYNGLCAANEAACGTTVTCPTDQPYLCPSGLCVKNDQLCQQLRECNEPTTYRCPADGTCVDSADQCPTAVGCPFNTFKCQTGECSRDPALCNTVPEACSANRPYRCSDGTCAVDNTFCPTPASCGATKPILCPDHKSCVTNADDCAVVQPCPAGTSLCSTGDCRAEGQCPSAITCPPATPVSCPDGRCVTSKTSCESADIPICPAASPIRCGSGRCVKDYALCDTLIQCPYWKPLLCSSGQCVSAIEDCPEIPQTSVCPTNYITCPVTGACAKYYAWCPTLRSCLDGEIRCANGQCYPASSDPTVEACPRHARNVLQCPDGQIQCPITNTGVMCRASIAECPTDVVCPTSAPFRCESNQCAASPEACAIMDATEIPDTRVPCGMGTWASSTTLCGTPPTCPPTSPILCLDGSCRQHPNDCPQNNECSPALPFKCASGECQLNSYSCSLSKCSDANKPIRCPASTANTRCVAKIEDCPNIFDSSLLSSFTSLCTFGARCWDGTCVSETRLCPTRRCPAEAPFLCRNGSCAREASKCRTDVGCPFDLPFFCQADGSCQADVTACSALSGNTCAPIVTVDEEGNEVTTERVKCSDGTCRDTADSCLLTGPFGCPPETPLRCGDGTCATRPSATDTTTGCQTTADTHNACTADRPYRCPGGFCSTSSTRCPTPSIDTSRPVCRSLSGGDYMGITCDDGSCAFSLAECPTLRPCGVRQFRCGDGTCRDLPCDPNVSTCRTRLAALDYMGASCPAVNTCPQHLPYRCQSGECALNREQCQSLYPIRLNACCGPTATFTPSSGTLTPQGEDLGVCTELTGSVTCTDSRLVDDDSGRAGCPIGTQRCAATGHCIESALFAELCEYYRNAFDTLQNQSDTCAYRCPSGRCVDAAKQCTETNGCPVDTPFLCADGLCVADSTTCTAATEPACALTCPGNNKRCVESINECTTLAGCPLASPFLCADGVCKTRASTQKGATLQPWPNLTPNGLAADMCAPTLACSGFTPHLCGDGSCQPDSSSCPPMVNRCGGTCRVACPLTNECVQLESIQINSVFVCDISSLSTLCSSPTAQCPAARPFICPSGACVAAPTDCSSPFFDDARTLQCTGSTPFRCINGDCVATPLSCVIATALANGFEAPTATTAITNTNVCDGSYVCPDGSCVSDPVECGFIAACPAGSTRCGDGTCAPATLVDDVWVEGVCAVVQEACSGSSRRCADGLCRSVCPQTNGCDLDAPFSCAWSSTGRCTATAADCSGFNAAATPFITTSVAALTPYTSAQIYRFDALASRFPGLDFAAITAAANALDARDAFFMETLQTASSSFAPDSTQVSTCFSNCERDIPATQSTTLLQPSTTVNNLVISANKYYVPRTTLTVPAGAVPVTSELNIYPTPAKLFDGADFLSSGITYPFNWKGEAGSGTPGEFASRVISSPFTCTVTRNDTAVQTNKPFAVTAYVDLKSYSATAGGETTTESTFPCAFTGEFDSALAGKNCGGTTRITNDTLTVDYDPSICEWSGANVFSLTATFDSIKTIEEAPDTVEWNGQSARQVICMTVTSSTRQFGVDASGSITGQQFCATFVRITDLILITFPDNFIVAPHIPEADASAANLLSPDNLLQSLTTFPTAADQVISNAYLDTTTASTCSTSTSDITQIPKQDICLGSYNYQDATWSCLAPTYENRTANPTWSSGMRLTQVSAPMPACNQDAYAFLYVPLPEPVVEEDEFCFWCEYGWIILLVCILFVVILLIIIFCAMRFYRHRMQYKEEKKKLEGLQEHALDLAENQGGLGVADADGEINMTVNPLVLQLQDLNKQLEDANLKLDTMGQEEEFHIQRLQQQRQRIQLEIKRLEESLAHDESAKLAPKRIEAVGPSTTSSTGPQGPMRTGPSGPSGPSTVGNPSGPMRAPPK